MTPPTFDHLEERRFKFSTVAGALINVNLLLVMFYVFPIASYCRGARQEQQPKEALGSLTSAGEVYVNDDQAARESTIFSGDRVRTGEVGAASFVMSGKGTLKIAPQSQVLFSGNDQFTADLEAGTIALTTISGPNGLSLRIGNYVVVSYSRQGSTTLEVNRAPNGSVSVSCVEGSAGVLTLEGKVGQYLQAGQSMAVSANSFLPLAKEGGTSTHSGWLLLGLGGAGAAAAIAFLMHGSAGQSVSPSAP